MQVELPGWLQDRVSTLRATAAMKTPEARMRLAIALARENVDQGTGGPFGAVVTDRQGRLLGVGVNRVVAGRCAILHAEIVALCMAHAVLGHYDLRAAGEAPILSTSVDPCAMCLGALVWSRIRRLECGACTEDAEQIGFDEGPKPVDWVDALVARGIDVARPLLRQDARDVLQIYAARDGLRY